ncbi:MAG: ribosomal protein L13e [Thaumarchaeota archaeon]|nr:ribosomal protein L13e [Nitrososphaerota archaeon]
MSAKDKKAKPKGKAPTRKAPAPKVQKAKKAVKAPVEEKPKKAAPRAKKVAERKEAPAKVSVKAEPVVLGPPPAATVASRHIDSLRERPGRGFSVGELASAGVPLNTAKREGLPLDIRRRSVVEGNVEALKGWFKSGVKAVAVPSAAKK